MKYKQKTPIALIIATILLTLSACNLIIDHDPKVASITLKLPQKRALADDCQYYELICKTEGAPETKARGTPGETINSGELTEGVYTVEVYAYNENDKPIAHGEKSDIIVVADQTTYVTITLTAIEEDTPETVFGDFRLTLSPPEVQTTTSNGETIYLLPNTDTALAQIFTITATPTASAFPDGTTFSWSHDNTNWTDYATYSMLQRTLDEMGVSSITTTAQTITVSCKMKLPNKEEPEEPVSISFKVKQASLPEFKIVITCSLSSEPNALGESMYKVTSDSDLSTNVTLTATPTISGESFPTGTSFSWKVNNGSWSSASNSAEKNSTISELCSISGVPNSSTGYPIECQATNEEYATTSASTSFIITP